MSVEKKFGLILPKIDTSKILKKNSVFDDDSDDEHHKAPKRPKIPQKKIKTEVLAEDPSIYEYDNIYDEMKCQQQKEIVGTKEKKNSRYIETLLKAAEKRKKEYERHVDKKIQAEREKEGDQFKDKESFVTSAYKKKMQEQDEEEERERRENMLNEMMDVTKQENLSGFYRHFLNQSVGEEEMPQIGNRGIKKEPSQNEFVTKKGPEIEDMLIKEEVDNDKDALQVSVPEDYADLDRDSDNVEIDSSASAEESDPLSDKREMKDDIRISKEHRKEREIRYKVKGSKSKLYEKNNMSGDEKQQKSDNERPILVHSEKRCKTKYREKVDEQHAVHCSKKDKRAQENENDEEKLPCSRGHRNRNYREKDDQEQDENSDKNGEYSENSPPYKSQHLEGHSPNIDVGRHDSDDESSGSEAEVNNAGNEAEINKKVGSEAEKHKKVNIYAKRTVGEIFAEAQARCFQRMAARKGEM